jgi:hypothetical protein
MNKSFTKNLLAKLSLFLLLFVFADSCTSGGAKKGKRPDPIETEPSTSDKDMGPKMKPILLIIGEDLSGSYEGFVKFNEENLKDLCKKITQSGRGGAVAVFGIGDPTPHSYEYYKILRDSVIPGATLIQKKIIADLNKKKKEKNQVNQASFLQKANIILNNKGQKQTDINGFFEKARIFSKEEQFNNYEKWLFVNSDGNQDVIKSSKKYKTVNCDLRPSTDKYYTSGWKKSTDCSPDGNFLDPGGFISFFTNH